MVEFAENLYLHFIVGSIYFTKKYQWMTFCYTLPVEHLF